MSLQSHLHFLKCNYNHILFYCCDIFGPIRPSSGGTRERSWLRHHATSRKVAGSSPDEVDFFFNLPNLSSFTMALGSTQPLTEMVPGIFLGGKERPARKADNFTDICEPIV
jgi:hypothetical protein